MTDYRVRLMSNQQGGFYELVGPVLSRREIVKELGHPVWDDDDKTWSVAIAKSKLIACVALTASGKVSSLYVVPDRRLEGIATRLLERAVNTAAASEFTATVTPMAVVTFERCGFRKTGARGCYSLMVR